jgi:Tfp pilus assembly protein PilF
MGLGLLGKNDRQEAKAEFKRVLELDPNHLRAGTQLSLLE